MRLLLALTLFALAACAEQSSGSIGSKRSAPGPLPATPVLYGAVPYGTTAHDNGTLAQLFVHLGHDLEWGARRPNLVRLEQPVRVEMTGCCTADYTQFLDSFLGRMRTQTGIDIARASGSPNLRIHFVPGGDFRARIPDNLCVVAPGALPWERFREDPTRFGTKGFETAERVTAMSVYLPDTASPHLIRRCLIEETTQALGLANDLNGLSDSIFNDDGAHIWPTAIDLLMLRVLYAPEIQTGLNRRETRARARTVLDRINPQGRSAPPLPKLDIRAMSGWAGHIGDAFDTGRSISSRRASAETALSLAANRAPQSAYHCRSLFVLARLSRPDPATRARLLERSLNVCRSAHGPDDPRIALIKLSLARSLMQQGRASMAYDMSGPLGPHLAAHGHTAALSARFALQAEALGAIQRPEDAARARRMADDWARYALGRKSTEARNRAQR